MLIEFIFNCIFVEDTLFGTIFTVLVNIRGFVVFVVLLLLLAVILFILALLPPLLPLLDVDIDDTLDVVWSYTIESIFFLLGTVLKLRHEEPVPVPVPVPSNVDGCNVLPCDFSWFCTFSWPRPRLPPRPTPIPVPPTPNGFYLIDFLCSTSFI